MKVYKLKIAGLMAAALIAFVPNLASAAGTTAGTNITNLATLSFSIGATPQVGIESSAAGNSTPGANSGTSTDFVVDRKINFTVVTTDATAVAATPGATGGSIITFTVTNTGNAPEDFALAATAVATAAAATFGGLNDAINAGTVGVFVETAGGAGYQSASDTTSFIDELAANAVATVYIVSGLIPANAVNGNVASYHLLATAGVGGGAGIQGIAEVATAPGSETLAVQDVLFADGQGTDTANDALRDGKESAQSDYQVASAVITVSKTAVVKSDPINGTTNPQAIPGAVITYTITIANAAAATASASLTTISDVLNAALKINQTGASWTVTGSTRATATGALVADTLDATVIDGLGVTDQTLPGGTLTATFNTFMAIDVANGYAAGELKAGDSVALVFDVTLQ